ncbi:Diacylglycerol kinase delta [Orchesella cincta]|uniref:Diacylglycerol kinase n=1 Tax=Orchesella cincta TaxID=48709 RepID=A0A1D2N9J9_ORCCI|nr:Diacylglycerol kinase delta [Orchesella cincta]
MSIEVCCVIVSLAQIFDEIDLSDLTIAESSSKTFKHCFQVITPDRVLILAADSRPAMEEWIFGLRNASFYETGDHSHLLSGAHVWYATSHARPTYCNICREQLCGVTSHGLSCEICKFKAHKKCASKAHNNCKWTTLASMGKDIIEELDGTLSLPHQWLEGNLPVSAKCDACEKTCGSVLRLQDFRCLWCRTMVHQACKTQVGSKCPLGKISVVPPTALHTIGSDDAWEASRPLQGCSPLLVFVNSKSGDHQGLKFLRRFKQLLNPAQVFDLVNGGPRLGLQLFRHFEPFRILVCGGDGSVGWVMSEIDKLDMHRQCQVGVLPLGTGNDLARVLGWGASCDDDTNLSHLLEKYEKATTKMLDRWSIMTFERGVLLKPASCSVGLRSLGQQKPQIAHYEDSVVSHLQNILQSDQHQAVISSAKVLCETVRDMIGKLGTSAADSEINEKCATLSQKLDSLLQTLQEETEGMGESTETEPSSPPHEEEEEQEEQMDAEVPTSEKTQEPQSLSSGPSSRYAGRKVTKFRQREALMSRANSLKKAVRQIIEHAEKTLDEQNAASHNHKIVVVRPMSLTVEPTPRSVEKDILSPDSQTESTRSDKAAHDDDGDENFATNNRIETNIPTSAAVEATLQARSYSNQCASSSISPIDPNVTLPVPSEFADQARKLSNASTNASTISAEDLEDEVADLDRNDIPLIDGSDNSDDNIPVVIGHEEEKTDDIEDEDINEGDLKVSFPKIESDDSVIEADNDTSIGGDDSCASNNNDSGASANIIAVAKVTGESTLLAVPGSKAFPRGASPRASRRISMGSLLKPLEVEIPTSPKSSKGESDCFSYSSAANSPFSSSAHSSPNKSSSHQHSKRKTLPIVNPLVSHPAWPAVASGGLVSKVLLANADTICAVASPLMDPEIDPDDLMLGFDEKCVMNNYFGIGIDAKITLDFHLKREEHPEKCRSRTRNFMWYGVLGGKEFLQKSCKNLEQRVQLECDGKRLPLPSLQGIVILNIQSFMGGTNFWGGTKEDDYFLAPSFDDKILEVVAVFDTMQMAASRLINLQHHRIAQCHQVKITMLGDEPIPVQVDGEAWLQPPGVIRIVHRNRMQMLCRNRALETSLKAWEEKQKHSMSPSATEHEELDRKRHSKGIFKLKFRKEKRGDEVDSAAGEILSDGFSEDYGSSETKSVDKWTSIEVSEWLEHLQLSEYKVSFLRHDIRGAELLSLQRRDLRELGVTKVGHLKRILRGIEILKRDTEYLANTSSEGTAQKVPFGESSQN